MNKDLYYCKHWEHIFYGNYEVCVSDIIYSNDRRLAQIHMIVMKNGEVVRGISTTSLKKFEKDIRAFIRNEFYNNTVQLESEIIKIWYYNIEDSEVDPCDVPLRLAVTFNASVEEIPTEKYGGFRRRIYDYLYTFLMELNRR